MLALLLAIALALSFETFEDGSARGEIGPVVIVIPAHDSPDDAVRVTAAADAALAGVRAGATVSAEIGRAGAPIGAAIGILVGISD